MSEKLVVQLSIVFIAFLTAFNSFSIAQNTELISEYSNDNLEETNSSGKLFATKDRIGMLNVSCSSVGSTTEVDDYYLKCWHTENLDDDHDIVEYGETGDHYGIFKKSDRIKDSEMNGGVIELTSCSIDNAPVECEVEK